MAKRTRYLLAAVIVLAIGLRFARLDAVPKGVFRDEAEKGYSAWSIAKLGGVWRFTGSDGSFVARRIPEGWVTVGLPEAFEALPLFHNVWGSTTSMLYQYAAVPFIAATGPRVWAVRIPAALAGLAAVLLAFSLGRRLFRDENLALWAAALVAVAPAHLVFSRWAQQGILVPPLLITALWLGIGALEDSGAGGKRRVHPALAMALAGLLYGLAFYAYSGARPFLLLFAAVPCVLWRRELRARPTAALCAVGGAMVVILPTLFVMLTGGMGRFRDVSIFGGGTGLFHSVWLFVRNYMSHFSPAFLFATGDALPRHALPGCGVLIHIAVVLLPIGLWVALRRRSRPDLLVLGWFVLAPVSAALTREGVPHALRSLHVLPAPQMLSALGACALVEWANRRVKRLSIGRTLACLWATDAALIALSLFVYFPHLSAPAFEYGPRAAFERLDPDARRVWVVPGGSQAPLAPELYHFLNATPPESLRRRTVPLPSGRPSVALIPLQAFPQVAQGHVQPRDRVLVDAALYERLPQSIRYLGAGADWGPIRYRPHPLRPERKALVYVGMPRTMQTGAVFDPE